MPAKNEKLAIPNPGLEKVVQFCLTFPSGISSEEFQEIQILGEKPRTVWVAIIEAEISKLKGQRKIAIVMSTAVFEDAEDIDYLITNVEGEIVTEQWIVGTYSERNWVEVFYP